MTTLFGIDGASFQGDLNWALLDEVTAFGWEKVTQGTGYANPFWPRAKAAMAARAKATGFTPGGYMFLEHGDGAAQAQWFARNAGDMDGFGIGLDVEPEPDKPLPSMADALAAAHELRQLYPRHPIVGYIPHWFWGGADTTFADVLWASNYVTAPPAPPPVMYGHVTAGQWAGYGGQDPALLQFTSRCALPGAAGAVDCSAFRGTQAQYRALVLPGAAPPPPRKPAPPAPHVVTHITQGRLSLHDLAAKHRTTAPHILHLTVSHFGGFPPEVAAWLSDVFGGVIDAQADVPAGLHLRVPVIP